MRVVGAVLFAVFCTVAGPALAQQPEATARGPVLSKEDFAQDQLSRFFRMGVNGYGVLTGKDPNIQSLLGAGIQLPVYANVYWGLGFRASFYGHYQKQENISLQWRAPDPAYGDQDDVWEVGEKPAPLTDGSVMQVKRLGHNAVYSLCTSFYYELTSPRSSVLQIWQPFVGVGPMFIWIYTYTDIQANEVYLIDNADNDVDDPNNVDPFAVQFVPALDVFGGFHFNLGRSFRLSLEVGYLRAEIPAMELRKATEGYEARHLGYTLNIFRFGGGFHWRL